ncbi:alpha/beta hydrolase [Microvirga thermotolerans]|uniref:Alpha/beta hydrolase n=1 Tax=Microvirga thermotolerans TaxID=2651334 RepID=A0A5P9JU11_9HYPH|nr:alpha/beta hydrolase [Microvirga thermotolerans]QFU16097.1 alpha/beta hydrolase [Microvirga thermotolerans]
MTTTTLNPGIGRSTLPFIDPFHPERPLEVNFYRPASHGPDDPVVIVQHGMLRNGDEYRDFWIPAAERHRILIAAPTFSDGRFPKAESYNNGLVLGEDGAVRPFENWLYAVPGRVFAALRKGGVTRRSKARLFGHSAGGQFAHRLLATQDHEPYEAVIAANPGWYTLPTLQRAFPEGLGGVGLDEAALARWFAYPMHIFAGDRDISVSDPNLPAQDEALRQGPHRYARAHYVYDFARQEAERRGLPFRWQLVRVEGVGHDGAAMSRAAAAFWFEGRVPPADELVSEQAAAL